MRRAARTDPNQQTIINALKRAGCTVQDLSKVGGGCPDLLAARGGKMWLLEVKSPAGPKGGCSAKGQRLNGLQQMWAAGWRAPVAVVTSVDEALAAVGAVR